MTFFKYSIKPAEIQGEWTEILMSGKLIHIHAHWNQKSQILTPARLLPPFIGRFRVRCGAGVRIRQSYSDFNERGDYVAGGRKWAQQARMIPVLAGFVFISSVKHWHSECWLDLNITIHLMVLEHICADLIIYQLN